MRELYKLVQNTLEIIDFSQLWPGFKPYPFALYDQHKVYFSDHEITKTNDFYGNTAIMYHESILAIWHVTEKTYQLPIEKLTSQIVHEMFHAYQFSKNETRYGNEFFGLSYPYSALNLSSKYQENQMISSCLLEPTQYNWQKIYSLRHQRTIDFPEALEYETRVETLEGMAKYIEMKVLKILKQELFIEEMNLILKRLKDINNLVPIRMINYDSGAALMLCAEKLGLSVYHKVGVEIKTLSELLLSSDQYSTHKFVENEAVSNKLHHYQTTNKEKVESLILQAKTHIKGTFTIIGFDPLNTTRYQDYIYCQYFLAYEDQGKKHYIHQSTVAKMNADYTLSEIFY